MFELFYLFFFFFNKQTNKTTRIWLFYIYIHVWAARFRSFVLIINPRYIFPILFSVFVFVFFFAEMLYKLHLFIDEQIWACAVDAGKPTLDDIRAYC